jgi:hypothetical protein
MYKYKKKNDTVKLNSALNNTNTHPRLEHRHIILHVQFGKHHIKTVMITNVLPTARKDLAGTSF